MPRSIGNGPKESVKETAGSNDRTLGSRLDRVGVREETKVEKPGKQRQGEWHKDCHLHSTLLQEMSSKQETMSEISLGRMV